MSRSKLALLLALLFVVALALPCYAAPAAPTSTPTSPGIDPAFEKSIYDRLAQANPQAVETFRAASEAARTGNLETARAGFEQVLVLVPDNPDALRRLSSVTGQLGDRSEALALARRAYQAEASPYNSASLAEALVNTGDEANADEALSLARAADKGLPEDGYVAQVLLAAAVFNDDLPTIREATNKVLRLDPTHPFAHYLNALLLADSGKYEQAESELRLAESLGMPSNAVQHALDSGISSQARFYRYLRYYGLALVGWVAGIGVLFLLGMLLSNLTVSAARRAHPQASYRVGIGERILRMLYGVVILLATVYFYLSVPLLVLLLLTLVGGTVYLFVRLGRIPIRLLAVVVIAGLATIYAVVRSIFARVQEAMPGRPLPRSEAPSLWTLAEEVAARVGTRPIHAVYLVPGTEIAVTERGGLLQKLRGAGRRYLILGLGALAGLSQGELTAILAHEYGHFAHGDTAGGSLALNARAAMHQMAYRLSASGLAVKYNPAWLFLSGYYRAFLRITLGATRLQEILADRHATIAYGASNFAAGLTRVVRQSLAFNMQVGLELEQSLVQQRPPHNFYALAPIDGSPLAGDLEKAFQEVQSRPTSPYDSHPSLAERLRLIQALEDGTPVPGSAEPAWLLLPNAEALQEEISAEMLANVKEAYRWDSAKNGDKGQPLGVLAERLALTRQFHDRAGEALMLGQIGDAFAGAPGQGRQALQFYEQAHAIFRELGDKAGEASILCKRAKIHHKFNELPAAARMYREALATFGEIGDLLQEDRVRRDLALVMEKSGPGAGSGVPA